MNSWVVREFHSANYSTTQRRYLTSCLKRDWNGKKWKWFYFSFYSWPEIRRFYNISYQKVQPRKTWRRMGRRGGKRKWTWWWRRRSRWTMKVLIKWRGTTVIKGSVNFGCQRPNIYNSRQNLASQNFSVILKNVWNSEAQ